MNILFLAPCLSYPVRTGGHNRTLGMIRCLSRMGSVRVLAIGNPADPGLQAARRRLGDWAATLEVFPVTGPGREDAARSDVDHPPESAAHFRSPALASAIRASWLARPPDLVFFEELVMAQYADDVWGVRILDRQKIESVYHLAMADAGGEDAVWHRGEAERFRRWENALGSRFDAILATGQDDARLLAALHGKERVHVVPIGVDDAIARGGDRTSDIDHVLLYGSLDYPPNVEANEIYFREIWPRITAAAPELQTVVVGSGRSPVRLPDDSRVVFRGYAEDVAGVLGGPGVLLAPLRVGGGSRTKILEALAAGMPVVATPSAVENLELTRDIHYLEAATPEAFVAAILRLKAEPELAARLSRAGARWIDDRFRWGVIGNGLATVVHAAVKAHAVTSGGVSCEKRRALLVGVHPLPTDTQARQLSFAGHRTAQFAHALDQAGCEVIGVLLDEEGGGVPRGWPGPVQVLTGNAFRAGRELQRIHDDCRPDTVVAAGGFHPARVVASLVTPAPRFIDLPGDLAAEGQLRAARTGDAVLADYVSTLALALAVGDRFSVVGPRQRLAVSGQLGLAGRLTGDVIGRDPIAVIPLASDGPATVVPLPNAGLRVLSQGAYNTWMDVDTLLDGLEHAMAHREDVGFVSMGGPVPGHSEDVHAAFWSRARASRFARRFADHGRVDRGSASQTLAACHLVVSIARDCLEAELGSRQRVVEALAHGRPVLMTEKGDLASEIRDAGAGITISPGDAEALGRALIDLAADRQRLEGLARQARTHWERHCTYLATTAPLVDWARNPTRWPRSGMGEGGTARIAERLIAAEAELCAMRSSRTFRALRAFDRLLGRGPSR